MRSRLLSVGAAALVLTGFLAGSPRASAEFVTLTYDGRTANPNVSVTLNNTSYDGTTNPTIPTGPFYWHENELPPNASFPPPTVTFCVEINPASQPLPTVGSNVDFAVTPLSGSNAAAITELYGRFYNNEAGTNWETRPPFNGSTGSTAFQLALWELIYDTDRNLATGSFKTNFTSGAVFDTAQAYLAALNGDTSSFGARFGGNELVLLQAPAGGGKSQDNIQDQITMRPAAPIPAPPGLILAGFGFVALVGRSRFGRRKAATA